MPCSACDNRSEAINSADADESASELGDLLFAVVNVARHLKIDAELALRTASDKFRGRFEHVERLAADRQVDLREAPIEVLDELWDAAKIATIEP